jgi:hypothetical protein
MKQKSKGLAEPHPRDAKENRASCLLCGQLSRHQRQET